MNQKVVCSFKPGSAGLFLAALLYFFCLANLYAKENEWAIFTKIDAEEYSSVTSLADLSGVWKETYRPHDRNVAYAAGQAEWGVGRDAWQFGKEIRVEKYAVLSRGASDLYRLYKSKSDPDSISNYLIQVNSLQFKGNGFFLDYDEARSKNSDKIIGPLIHSSVDFGARWEHLLLSDFRQAMASGVASYTDQKYAFNVNTSDLGRKADQPLIMQSIPSHGVLDSWSVRFKVKLSESERLRVDAKDLFSKLIWNGLPHATNALNSNVKTYTPEGYINYEPVLNGMRSYENMSTAISKKWKVEWEKEGLSGLLGSHGAVRAGVVRQYDLNQFKVVWLEMYAPEKWVSLGYDATTRAKNVSWQTGHFWVSLGFDQLQASRQYQALTLGASFSF